MTKTDGHLGLDELLGDVEWQAVAGDASVPVRDIAYDSRKAAPGDVFVALPGRLHDGHDHIGDALDQGVRTFVVERWTDGLPHTGLVIAQVASTRHALAMMSRRYFGFPETRLTVVALTGTKGKTTTSYMLSAILTAAGTPVGLIGSNGVDYAGTHVKLPNTTPESYELNRIMAAMADAGVRVLVMEATSQGFEMHRTDGVHFDIGVFTNISPDHISATEHASFADYLAAKQRIFTQSGVVLVNRDAELFDDMVAGAGCPLITYGQHADADYRGHDLVPVRAGHHVSTTFWCHHGESDRKYAVALPGEFNVSDGLAALAVADRLGVSDADIVAGLAVARAPGRMEELDVPAPYTVLIDFAHNGLSMQAAVDAVRAYEPARILAVFGLEGDRSRVRRFDCGEVLGREVDFTILADASPRFDDPDQILADIATGIERAGGTGKYAIIRDRHDAIPAILDMAGPGDIVLIIGKGAVPYEEVMGVNTPLDEHDIVREYFARKAG